MKYLITIICLICLFACKPKENIKPKQVVNAIVDNMVPTNLLDSITNAYINLKNAFVSDSLPLVNEATILLIHRTSYNPVKVQQILKTNVAEVNTAANDLSRIAQQIKQANDLKTKRIAFATMIEPIKIIIANYNDITLYVQHCPMAAGFTKDENAYWISMSNDSKIRNPFFPRNMLECGDVTDTLKKVKQ
jgi:hypothetical protein